MNLFTFLEYFGNFMVKILNFHPKIFTFAA